MIAFGSRERLLKGMKTHRLITLCGTIALLAVFLFPPYGATYLADGDNLHTMIGHRPIVTPPTANECVEALGGGSVWRCRVYIDESRWAIYFGLIIVMTSMLVLAYRDE